MAMTVTGVVYRTGNHFRNRWEWLVAGDRGQYVWHGYTFTKAGAIKAVNRTLFGDSCDR